MSELQFEENDTSAFRSRTILGNAETPKMINFLINKGIVKDQKTAGKLLLVLCAVFILTSIYILAAFVFDVNFTNRDKGDGLKIVPLNQRI
jgi:hypothetical protein